MGKKVGMLGVLGSVAAGAALGVLLAPKSGKETRKDLKKKMDELVAKTKDIDAEDVKQYVTDSIEKIRNEIDDLSMEKVSKVAKKKANELKKNVSDLATYVKKKGTPVLEDAVEQVRLKAIDVTESVLVKLEKGNTKKSETKSKNKKQTA